MLSPSPLADQLPVGAPAGLSAGPGVDISIPISFCQVSSCHRPRQRQLGLSPEPGVENRNTAVCCPAPGSSQLPPAALQPPRHPAPVRVMNGHSGSKTCCKWEFPFLLKKVPALPGNLSREGDVFHAGGKFFVRLWHPSGLGEAAKPGCPL